MTRNTTSPKKEREKKQGWARRDACNNTAADENCLQAALQERITEEASISCVNEWQVHTQPPVHAAQHAKHGVVNMHKHSELNRWSNRSALLCANAPEISARCISQPSVFFAKLACCPSDPWISCLERIMVLRNLHVLFQALLTLSRFPILIVRLIYF